MLVTALSDRRFGRSEIGAVVQKVDKSYLVQASSVFQHGLPGLSVEQVYGIAENDEAKQMLHCP